MESNITVQDAVTTLTQTLTQTLTEALTEALNVLRDEMRQEIRETRLRIDDVDYNSRARLRNSAITRPEYIVSPLKNLDTHQVVKLPETARELSALRTAEVEHYLQQLGQVPVGSAEEKRTQLTEFIGINY
ncbi:hypothetical protein F5Y10DRAFT_290373 [Nemania abortiva]|nr:hypothetical protein F5Y10DRAFT_290373 [Nemania abortiva]